MEAWLGELRPYPGEGRWGSGWRLAKSAWRLLRTDPALRWLALLLTGVVGVAFCGQFAVEDFSLGLDQGSLGVALLCHAFLAFGAIFVLFALLAAADAAIDGLPMETGEALAEARELLPEVLRWGLVLLAASLAIWWANSALGWGAATLASVAFYLATAFVVPSMVVERSGPAAAWSESLRTIRMRGRPLLGGAIGIAVFAGLFALLPGFMLEHAAATRNSGQGSGEPLAIVALLLLALIFAVALGSREALALFLLRDELDDLPGTPCAGPRLRRRVKVLRFAGTCVAVIAVLVAAGALTEGDREVNTASNAPGNIFEIEVANPGFELDSGTAVYYRESEIGTVLGSEAEGSRLRVRFHVEPGYNPEQTPGSFTVAGSGDGCPCLVLVPGAGGGTPRAQPS